MSKYGIFVLGTVAVAVGIALAAKKGGKKMNTFNIFLERDEKVGVWIATSDDVPGLVLESRSYEDIEQRAKCVVPKLLELNKVAFDENNLSLNFIHSKVPVYA